MKLSQLENNIKNKKSFLCLGLDSDIDKIPKHLLCNSDPVFEFNKILIDELNQKIVAVKLNTAFYESRGAAGWTSMEKTINYLNKFYPELFSIADAKRGDIGNTSSMYARAFFEEMDFDSITVAPYMGSDSVKPFLDYDGKWAIVLALTSNSGGLDFQMTKDKNGLPLYKSVLSTAQNWGNNIMFVVGATRAGMLREIRSIAPHSFLLVPGIGAQGGSLEEVAENGLNDQCGLLINSSRGILYASSKKDFADKARKEAIKLQNQMKLQLLKKGLI